MLKKYKYQIIGSSIVLLVLSLINMHIKVGVVGNKQSMILAERFFKGGSWVEITIVVVYTFYIIGKMITANNTAKWRKITWTVFSVVFFSQLILGLFGFEKFLMTGMLHLPIPALIIGGAVYKLKFGFMPILFLSTVILSGPAWCSQLCYFGAVDFQASSSKKGFAKKIKNKTALKHTFLAIVVVGAIVLRFLNLSYLMTGIIAGSFGIIGVLIIIFISHKKKMMYHCSVYCPVGTILQYVKYINPFRMYIEESSCTNCMLCTPTCKYDALNTIDIKNKKPGLSCTYCGDCISSCHSSSIKYKVFNIKGDKARFIWITLTISLHAIFLVLARI